MALLARIQLRSTEAKFDKCKSIIAKWIDSLGPKTGNKIISSRNGPIEFDVKEFHEIEDSIYEVSLIHRSNKGTLLTEITLIYTDSTSIINIDFDGITSNKEITPFTFDVRTPRFIDQIISSATDWKYGSYKPHYKQDVVNGDEVVALVNRITDQNREIPVIVVADVDRSYSVLRQHLGNNIRFIGEAYFLSSSDAEDLFNEKMSIEHGCYYYGIRFYRPSYNGSDNKFRHPLWTNHRIAEVGEQEIGNKLRRLTQKASTENIRYPIEYDLIADSRVLSLESARKSAEKTSHYNHALYQMQAEENEKLKDNVHRLKKEIDRLNAKIASILNNVSTGNADEDISRDEIESVEDAIIYARKEYSDYLFFWR